MARNAKAIGKGRVVTPAPKSAKGKSTTSKSVGVRSRAKAPTKAPTRAQVDKAYADAKARAFAKAPYAPRKALYDAIVRAFACPTLASEGIATSAGQAGERRAFAKKARARRVSTADVVFVARAEDTEKVLGITTDRPENTVREALKGFCRVMGYPEDTFYAIRAERYAEDEVPDVFVVRK
jgi:hypothetical protein